METPPPNHSQQLHVAAETPAAPHVEWYRFVLLLTGNPGIAKEILRESFAAAADHVSQFRNKNRRQAWLARDIRERIFKLPPPDAPSAEDAGSVSTSPANELLGKVAALPEPDRSAFALFLCLEADPEELGELIGLRACKFSDALANARQALAPEQRFPGNAALRIHRPWGKDAGSVTKAVRAANKKPETQAELAAQVALDEQYHTELESMLLPASLSLPELSAAPAPGWRAALRQPAVVAIGIALLVVMGVLVYGMVRRLDDFPGKETVSQMVEDTDEMNGMELEPVNTTEAGKLADWFVLKGYEDFAVPPELERAKAVGCRVYKYEGHPVAQVALDQQNALLLVFHGADMKVALNTLAWYIFQQDGWAVAARGDGENTYVVAFQGDSDDMKEFLHTVGK